MNRETTLVRSELLCRISVDFRQYSPANLPLSAECRA
jgi:hypothetical protein